MPTDAEHSDAIGNLKDDPKNAGHAQRLFDLARQDPDGAHDAHAREKPHPVIPPGVPHPVTPPGVDGPPYRRNNLSMPYSPKLVASPRTLDELITTMRNAAADSKCMKAIGDGYGFSNAGFTRGYLLPLVKDLVRILPIDPEALKQPEDAKKLFRFEAGATIDVVTRALWDRQQTLLNQPGYEHLTYVGVMSAGGHGSGTWTGPLSDHVRAIHLLTVDETGNVVQYQIERTNGISRPDVFKAQNPDVRLIQNDAMLDACAVAMGCFGIIYSVTIEVQAAFNIRESRKKLRWSEIKKLLPDLLANQGPGKPLHSIEVWLNPYKVDGDVWAILGKREWTKEPPRGERPFVVEYGGPEFLYKVIAWWCHHFPDAVPGIINAAMTATQSDEVIMEAFKGLNFGAPNLAPVTAASCGAPTKGIENTVDALIQWFQQRAADTKAHVTSPVGLRFVRAASAHMSPSHAQDTCMIEVPILLGVPLARETLDGYHEFMYQNCKGRPHWGQVNDVRGDRLHLLYPKLDAFLEAFNLFNPGKFFDNDFTDQMRFRPAAGE